MIKMEESIPDRPKEALEKFRTDSIPFILEQVKLFNSLGLSDRIELLFFLYMNQQVTLAQIGSVVQLMARGKKPD